MLYSLPDAVPEVESGAMFLDRGHTLYPIRSFKTCFASLFLPEGYVVEKKITEALSASRTSECC